MAGMFLGTNDRNDPGEYKGTDCRRNCVIDKKSQEDNLKAEHLGRCEKPALHAGAEAQQTLPS
jgi:hypothetical protein